MTAYVIYHYKIIDRERVSELRAPSEELDKLYGGELVVASPVKHLEGSGFTHMVMKKFDSFQSAQVYFNSDEHQALSKLRNEITEGWSTIVPGIMETELVVQSGYFD